MVLLLFDDGLILDIMVVFNYVFIFSVFDCDVLERNMIFYILRVVIKYVECFKLYEVCLLKYIDNFYIEKIFKKVKFFIVDFFDKSENKIDEMIFILEYIYENYIVYIEDDLLIVIEKKVFGVDVFINE